MTFGEKLVRLRKTKAVTQDEFASAVEVSRQAVYKWESGQSYPEYEQLRKIKDFFGVSLDKLMDDMCEDFPLPEKKKRKRISKADKERIEAEVRAELGDVDSDEKTEEAKEVEEEPVAEHIPAEQPVMTKEEPVEQEEIAQSLKEEEQEKQKKGFFGRLFGRK